MFSCTPIGVALVVFRHPISFGFAEELCSLQNPEVHCEYRRVGVDRGAHLVGSSLHLQDESQNIFFCLEARTVQTMSFTSNVSWL